MNQTKTRWDEDIAKARDLLDGEGLMPASEGTIYAIAAAIADGRGQVIARFAELAVEIDANARVRNGDGHLVYPARDRRPMHECAEAIRRVVREAS